MIRGLAAGRGAAQLALWEGRTSMRMVWEGTGPMTSAQLSPKETVERNLAAVDAHFHNENPQDIDKAIDLYGDSIVWEAPPACGAAG